MIGKITRLGQSSNCCGCTATIKQEQNQQYLLFNLVVVVQHLY